MKNSICLLLLFSGILFPLYGEAFNKITSSIDTREGIIGVNEKLPVDHPVDNIFHVEITGEICGDETAWLVYELYGLENGSDAVKSINDELAYGGHTGKLTKSWSYQKERIRGRWLREGDNIIRFNVPTGAEHGYKVKNVSIQLEQSREVRELILLSENIYYATGAYLNGFITGPGSEQANLNFNGYPLNHDDGYFEISLATIPKDNSSLELEVLYEDGESFCTEVLYSESGSPDYFFTPEQRGLTYQSIFQAGQTGMIELPGAAFHVGSDALSSSTLIKVTGLRQVDIPPLDPGMINVTRDFSGYRFLPHGTNFMDQVQVELAFDREKIPDGYTEADIRTYFFDEQTHHWVVLGKDSLLSETDRLRSFTTHFTDMINGIIKVPESPEVAAYNSTSMKGIKAANPTAGINLMQPPMGNNMGNANISYPINLPPGRNGMQPGIALTYNNGGGNGWVGLGWSFTVPSISIDTRWGVPRYDSLLETETYLLNGSQLSPVSHRGDFQPRSIGDKRYYPRVEGAFQKIERHGDSPKNYWWEVTDKNGTRYFYGGSSLGGFEEESVLRTGEAGADDAKGYVAQWCLREVRDLNGNFLKYHYEKQADSGSGDGTGAVQGYEIYCSEISYTGHNTTEGRYKVRFTRDRDAGGGRRPDVSIDARLGFKRVTADLLKRIDVVLDNVDGEELIRSYELVYQVGAFSKTLLKEIQELDAEEDLFTTHELDYYDDVDATGGYQPFGSSNEWSTGNDQISTGLITESFGFSGRVSALSGTKGLNGGFGMTLTAGLNDGQFTSKSNTIGGSYGATRGESEGLTMMADMNGDGLPDKLFKKGGQLFYRPNLVGEDGSTTFGSPKSITGIGDFMQERNDGSNWGVEAHAGFSKLSAFIGYSNNNGNSTTSTYLTDANGDQLIDIVRNGQVFFNNLNRETGEIAFIESTDLTPNPISSSETPDEPLFERTQEEIDALIDGNPLHDMIRVWRAPFDGQLNIDAPVSLLGGSDPSADGVKVSIQHEEDVLWSIVIPAGDQSLKTPTIVDDLFVTKGDRLFFRVQSIENGSEDRVNWSPEIKYLDKPDNLPDANGLPTYAFSLTEDFILTGPYTVAAPIDGTIQIDGFFEKPVLTDDIRVQVIKNPGESGEQLIIDNLYGWKEEVATSLDFTGVVSEGDLLAFKVKATTNVDWNAIRWRPKMYYVASDDPDISEVITVEDTLILNYPVVDFQLQAKTIHFEEPFVVADSITDSLQIIPSLQYPILSLPVEIDLGDVFFSIKRQDTLVYKDSLFLTSLALYGIDPVKIKVNGGDTLYLEYHIPNYNAATSVNAPLVQMIIMDTSFFTTGSIYTKNHDEQDIIYGPLYRNWGHFAYNGNRDRADNPIDLALLELNDKLLIEQNGSDISSPDDLTDPYDPREDIFIYLYADGANSRWAGFDEFTYLNAEIMNSSRLGLDDLGPPVLTAGSGQHFAVDKITRTDGSSVSAGAGGGFVGGSVTDSNGGSEQYTDFMDLNGDRYPDIFSRKGVLYSLPSGRLTKDFNTLFHAGNLSETNTSGVGASVNGSFKVKAKSGETGGAADESDASDAKTNGSISINGGTGTNNSSYSWTDINGDGLVDRVTGTGLVQLNTGYSLLDPEPWGHGALQTSQSTNAGAGAGFSNGSGTESSSISAGLGVAYSDNRLKRSLQDMNGDGLVDDVISDGDNIRVRFNTGNGFTGEYSWLSNAIASKSSTSSESINAAFTIGFTIPFLPVVKFCINPSGHGGQSVSRDESRFTDINGDGYPDYVESDNETQLRVKTAGIARTNMLRMVKRPLGSSFTLDYKPLGSTYEHPSTVWALTEVEMVDGFPGDGADTMRTAFEYGDGFYDRRERDFYGFDEVVTKILDTENDDEVYTITQQLFENKTYYEKGLLLLETMSDGEGNKFVQKENTYELRDIFTGEVLSAAELKSDDGNAFPAMVAMEQRFYEGQPFAGKMTSMIYEYDLIGNVTSFADLGDAPAEDELFASIEYHDVDAGDVRIQATPSSIEVRGTSGELYRKREASIDETTGNVTQIRQYLTDDEVAVYDMEYDVFGNLTRLTRPKNANDERFSMNYTYDEVVQTYTTSVNNSYGYSSSATYDFRFGQTLSTLDLNEQPMAYELDAKGRVVKITGPYEKGTPSGFTLKMEYHPEAAVPWALTRHYDPSNSNNDMETAIFVDGLGRVLQTKKDGAIFQGDGSPDEEEMIVSGRVVFDALGRTTAAYYPVTEPTGTQGQFNADFDDIAPTTTTYDVLNRALSVTLPDNAITQTSYGFGTDRVGNNQFLTQTTDANGVVTEQFTDVRSRVTAVKNITTEGPVWTSFTYNAINEQVAATDDLGHTTSSVYDNFGRRISRDHPDAGETLYTYDLAGNLTELLTANLAEDAGPIRYKYEFERLTDIEYPINTENNVHYTYGETGAEFNRAGRIVVQEDASGAQEFFYGPLGEVVKNIRTIVIPSFEEQTHVTEWTYDTWNRLTSMVYPDGEEVTYDYNTDGLLKTMTGNKKGRTYRYVTQLGYDKFEQRVFLAYGNGSQMTYSYEEDRRRLKKMTAATGAQRLFMDNEYTYDAVNNILGLKNNAPIPKPSFMGGASEYAYEYDDLYRLTSAEGHYTGPNEEHRYSLAMQYNTVGGILQKTQNHDKAGGNDWNPQKKTTYDLGYEYGEQQPHAPTQIGTHSYTYDQNGNQTGWTDNVSGQERKIGWDEENRIRFIYDNGNFNNYIYDASGERVIKIRSIGQAVYINGKKESDSGGIGNFTIYVNPYMVLRSGGYTKHYYIEGQRIVSKLGGGQDKVNNGNAGSNDSDVDIDYSSKKQQMIESIVKNLKWLNEDGTIKTAGNSGKIPPGQVKNPGNESENIQYYYHPDHLGSTSYITDITGEVYQHLEYFAFGETFVEEHSNTHRTPYLFNGKELDDETGLYYFGARYYQPEISIWLTVDPLAEAMPGLTPYRAFNNNPVYFTDPTGMLEFESYKAYKSYAQESGIDVLSRNQIGSQGHWLSSDRSNNSQVWKTANAYNLNQESGYNQYATIEQRADFYGWFQSASENLGHEIKWAGAASEVAHGINMLTWEMGGLTDALGYSSPEAREFAQTGNRMIFEDVFPKLRSLYNGPALQGEDALNWDAMTLSQEQHLIQPLYQSTPALGLLSAAAKQRLTFSSWVAPVKPFPRNGNLLDVSQRWEYGMRNMGHDVNRTQMPAPGINYTNGTMFQKFR
ncbi:MAG: SpvB/TcaC N-terminal domain-containing protein [Cyclobacteriaceae bacterium]